MNDLVITVLSLKVRYKFYTAFIKIFNIMLIFGQKMYFIKKNYLNYHQKSIAFCLFMSLSPVHSKILGDLCKYLDIFEDYCIF